MESAETRFAHLLQPIRELAKNWDVDVASELNDYLEELDEMRITFDGGSIRMNFAEAALLIQGSTCIYSKKVELLHSLVYQTLEYINDKNKKRDKQAAESQGTDGAAESQHSEEEDKDEFDGVTIDQTTSVKRGNVSLGETVLAMPLPPHALIPPESFEKNKFPLISLKGEVLCSLKDLKINLYIPRDDKGTILLSSWFEEELLPAEPLQLLQELQQQQQLEQQQQQEQDTRGAADAGDDVGGNAENEDFLPLDDNNMEVDEEAVVTEHVARQQIQSDGPTVRERRQIQSNRPREEAAPPAVEIWALHDLYSVLGEEKPVKPGKCYNIPLGLDGGGKRKRKGSVHLQDFRSWFTGTFDPPEPKMKNGPKCTDFNYIYLKALKDKVKMQRRIFKKSGESSSNEELKRTFLQLEGAGPDQQGEEPLERLRHPDLMGGDEDESDHDDMFLNDVPAEFDEAAADVQDQLSYEELVKLRVEQLVSNCRGFTRETALSLRVKEWEDMIRPELDLQAQRAVFDIHDYGDRMVRSLGAVGQRRLFSSIVHGLDNFEACKYLLASLQLANDYTVELDSAPGLEESLDSMGLTLLSTDRATDRFQTDGFTT